MKRAISMVLSPLLIGCVHRSPEARVLAAFREYRSPKQPADHAPDTSAAKCTSPRTSVAFIKGDTAIVALRQDCAAVTRCPAGFSCGMVRFGTDYLMLKKNGKWSVEKTVGGGAYATP